MAKKRVLRTAPNRNFRRSNSNRRPTGGGFSVGATIIKPACGEGGAPVVIENTCDNPIPIEACAPIPVIVENNVQIEKITYCNLDTDTHWIKVCSYSIDASGTPVETVLSESDTGIPCDEFPPTPPQIEKISYCNDLTKTTWIKVCAYAFNSTTGVTTETVLSETDSGVPCELNQTAAEIKCFEMCDDVNGDFTSITTFYEISLVYYDGTFLQKVDLGSFLDTDGQTPYVPINPLPCSDIGRDIIESQGRVVLQGGSWSPSPIIKSYTIRVDVVANEANPPQFTDSFGNTTPLFEGETFGYSFTCVNVDTESFVNSSAGDRIVITYIQGT